MKCPGDDTELVITHRQGVDIDYCPKCRGVWLDRGRGSESGYDPRRDYGRDRGPRDDRSGGRKSLLGKLFDF